MSQWQRSSFCSTDHMTGNCAEVHPIGEGGVLVRNSHRPDEVVAFSKVEWDALVAGIKAGEFDDLTEPRTATADEG